MKQYFVLPLTVALLFAQGAGRLAGRVTNNSGQAIANTVLILTESTSTASQRVTTAADGAFEFPSLPPGSYRVEVETPAGLRAASDPLIIRAGMPAEVTIRIDTGGSSAASRDQITGTIEVEAISPTVQTDSAEVARGYGSRTIRTLPLLDRQHQELISLMPGVTPPETVADRIDEPQRSRQMSVNGQGPYANVHHQDGALDTNMVTGRPLRIAPNEAVQSLDVRTSNYNAEYGFSGGSWSNTVTRPGTDAFHGSLFAFNTNSFFATRNPLSPAGSPDPRFNQNQFGGTAGGQIIPGRMFLFGSYDGFIRRGRELAFASVPTEALRRGDFTGIPGATIYNPGSGTPAGNNRFPFPGGVIPISQISPVSNALLGSLPNPNLPGLSNNLAGNTLLNDDTHRGDAKLDHRFSDSSTGFLRYGFTQSHIQRGSILGVLGDAADAGFRAHNAVASFSHSFSSTMLMEFRFGYGRYRNAIRPLDSGAGLQDQLSTLGFTSGIPRFDIEGFGSFGFPTTYSPKVINNTYNPATNWMLTTGMHRLKFGAEARRILADGYRDPLFAGGAGSFAFGPGATLSGSVPNSQVNTGINSFAAFLAGAPTQAGAASFLETPTLRQTQYAGYLTDTINLWRVFHLELGVRYDVYSPLETRRGGGATFYDPATNQVNYGGVDGFGMAGRNDYDLNNVAPRVGFAFQPATRFVVRGGYGIHFFPVPFQYAALNQTARAIQMGASGGFATTPFRVPTLPEQAETGAMAANQPFAYGSSDTQTPYVQSYSLMVQTDMGRGFLFDVGYVGTLGRQLPFSRALAALPGTGLAGLPQQQFDRTASTIERGTGLNNNYNAFQVNLTKRYSAGLSFAGAYTFSKALDHGIDLINPFDRRSNYGLADYDRQHILAISHGWQLPFGPGSFYFRDGVAAQILGNWEINGILRWATGTPYGVTGDPLLCNCPGVRSVFSRFEGDSIAGSASFDPRQFTAPENNSLGLGERNAFRGPDLFTYNMSLFRNFAIGDNVKLEFRGEAYNLTNSTNFANPVNNFSALNFGQAVRTFNGLGGRQFQVGGRFVF